VKVPRPHSEVSALTSLKRILVALAILMYIYGPEIELEAQVVAGSEMRMTSRTAPTALAGRYRLFVDTADGAFKCISPSGTNCIAATTSITIGTTTTGSPGTSAVVSNSGTSTAPILNFTIPAGSAGATGSQGPGITFRGPWAPSTIYNALDVVTNGGNTYEADHTFATSSSFNSANWNLWAAVGATGPAGGGVSTFTTTTWPSWLTPTVTNATTAPNLDVSGGIVPEANGGTGANNTPGAAGHVLRSNGTHYLDSAIQVADVPTLNQNSTGLAKGNVMSYSASVTGGLTVTPGNTNITTSRTTVPANITVVSFTMALGSAFTGCATFPTYQLFDVTGSTVLATVTMTTGTLYYSSTGLSATVASGHDVIVRVGTAAVTCTNGQSVTWAMWYQMT
jgi:hypothetical protein